MVERRLPKVEFKGRINREIEVHATDKSDFLQQIQDSQGLTVEVNTNENRHFKLVFKISPKNCFLELKVFINGQEIGYINALTPSDSPDLLSALDKRIDDYKYRYRGLSTVIQSVFFTYALLLGYKTVKGFIYPNNRASIKSREKSKNVLTGEPFITTKSGLGNYSTQLSVV